MKAGHVTSSESHDVMIVTWLIKADEIEFRLNPISINRDLTVTVKSQIRKSQIRLIPKHNQPKSYSQLLPPLDQSQSTCPSQPVLATPDHSCLPLTARVPGPNHNYVLQLRTKCYENVIYDIILWCMINQWRVEREFYDLFTKKAFSNFRES